MTQNELVNIVEALPEIQQLDMTSTQRRAAINALVSVAVDEVAISWDWHFAIAVADESTVADQSVYTLSGNDNECRDIINVRLGNSSDGYALLDKKRPVDMDDFITNRTLTGVGWWIPYGYSSSGFPKIKLFNAPSDATDTIRYRYRKNNITLTNFPDIFKFVLIGAIAKRLIPAYQIVFKTDLKTMIDRHEQAGGEDMPTPLDPVLVTRNNERAALYGYS